MFPADDFTATKNCFGEAVSSAERPDDKTTNLILLLEYECTLEFAMEVVV
jgi:hypothetical protein